MAIRISSQQLLGSRIEAADRAVGPTEHERVGRIAPQRKKLRFGIFRDSQNVNSCAHKFWFRFLLCGKKGRKEARDALAHTYVFPKWEFGHLMRFVQLPFRLTIETRGCASEGQMSLKQEIFLWKTQKNAKKGHWRAWVRCGLSETGSVRRKVRRRPCSKRTVESEISASGPWRANKLAVWTGISTPPQ